MTKCYISHEYIKLLKAAEKAAGKVMTHEDIQELKSCKCPTCKDMLNLFKALKALDKWRSRS